jgi:hypothetical protein
MATVQVEWPRERPADADAWERVMHDAYTAGTNILTVRMVAVGGGWRVDHARDAPVARTVGRVMRNGTDAADPAPLGDDWRDRIFRALQDAGLPVSE